jgi:hypothetical protein
MQKTKSKRSASRKIVNNFTIAALTGEKPRTLRHFLNFRLKIADITVTIDTLYQRRRMFMDGVLEIDSVLQQVRLALQRLRLPSDAAITQQILLLGDSFYGYRFTAMDFTAVWSAADQILKVFDSNGRALETFPTTEISEETSESIPMFPQRRAACRPLLATASWAKTIPPTSISKTP